MSRGALWFVSVSLVASSLYVVSCSFGALGGVGARGGAGGEGGKGDGEGGNKPGHDGRCDNLHKAAHEARMGATLGKDLGGINALMTNCKSRNHQ